MSKYAPLAEFLKDQSSKVISCTFSEIEDALGFKLPPSAYQHRAWWSNNPDNNVMTKTWLAAGFETTNVNIDEHTVYFRRTAPPSIKATARLTGLSDAARPFTTPHTAHHPLRGALKGTIRVTVDVDLTLPADPDWGANT